MTETYAESETEASRGDEKSQKLRADTDGSQNVGRVSTGTGTQCFQSDRKGGKEGDFLGYAVGGMLDQLIDDAEKQLVKSRECIVWYREEMKEYEQKLNNFRKLKELHLQQMAAAEAKASNDSNGGENLAE